jgi:hypothetical protein
MKKRKSRMKQRARDVFREIAFRKNRNWQGTGKQNHGTLENYGVGRSRQARDGFRYQTRIAASAAAAFMQIFPARAGFSPRAHGRPDGVPRGNFGAREESLHWN